METKEVWIGNTTLTCAVCGGVLSEPTFVAVREEEETALLDIAAHKMVNNDSW